MFALSEHKSFCPLGGFIEGFLHGKENRARKVLMEEELPNVFEFGKYNILF